MGSREQSFPTPLGVDSLNGIRSNETESHKSQAIRVSSELTLALRRLAEENQLTFNTLLQGAWAILLSRYSGKEEVVFGATRTCRNAMIDGVESMVGLLINTVPVRGSISSGVTLLPWLKKLRAQWIGMREYAQTPLPMIQEWLELPSATPLFESILVFENFELNSALRAREKSFDRREFQLIGRTNYPLTIGGYLDQRLLLKIDYECRRFDDAAIARMLKHFETLLEAIVLNPGERLSNLPILRDQESQQVLIDWNDTTTEYPKKRCVHEVFEGQVSQSPDAIALEFEEKQFTYRALNARANQLAHHLRKRGVGPDCLVGICMQRSPDLIVAMLAVLKAGGAYVPLDPSYPRERLAFMLADTGTRIFLTEKCQLEHLPKHEAEVVCLDSDWCAIAQESEQNPTGGVWAENLAYVIYTSGSTGRPKGVAVPHRAVIRLVCNTNYVELGPGDRVAQASNCSFDAATFEIWGALLRGACLVGIAKDVVLSSKDFAAQICEHKISTLFLTTALFNQLISEVPWAFKGIRHLLFGGEAPDPKWARELLSHGAPEWLLHVYGPTESTTFATWYLVEQVPEGATTIPIGRPISNTQIYLLDSCLRPVPVGVTGELYIGGDGLARGYLNRTETTAETFVPHPFSSEPGARLYKTGDRARYLADGNIEFQGRTDNQVKIRGFRIELGEIETALSQHPLVRQAVLIVDPMTSGVKSFSAYIVTEENQSRPATKDLREFLKEKLPEYMVPSSFVFLNSIPLTPNGKVDRNRLVTLKKEDHEENRVPVPPRTPLEETLVRIWCQVLGKEKIGILDNFFDLGGNSLLAIQLVCHLSRSLSIDISIRQLYDAPTVAALAEIIDVKNPKSQPRQRIPLRTVARIQGIPLTPRQEGFLE